MKDDFYTLVKIANGSNPSRFEHDLNHSLIRLAQTAHIVSVTIQDSGGDTFEFTASIVYQTTILPEEWSDFS